MDPTDAQRDRIARLKRGFGKPWPKVHAPDAATGVMRVELTCAAGVWDWFFGPAGDFVDGSLRQPLFRLDPPRVKPGNAINN